MVISDQHSQLVVFKKIYSGEQVSSAGSVSVGSVESNKSQINKHIL